MRSSASRVATDSARTDGSHVACVARSDASGPMTSATGTTSAATVRAPSGSTTVTSVSGDRSGAESSSGRWSGRHSAIDAGAADGAGDERRLGPGPDVHPFDATDRE